MLHGNVRKLVTINQGSGSCSNGYTLCGKSGSYDCRNAGAARATCQTQPL
jgi:hypothetical protein